MNLLTSEEEAREGQGRIEPHRPRDSKRRRTQSPQRGKRAPKNEREGSRKLQTRTQPPVHTKIRRIQERDTRKVAGQTK